MVHRTDIAESQSLYDQLAIDLQRAKQFYELNKLAVERLPKLPSPPCRFFTDSSESVRGAQCKEILIENLDAYLMQGGNPKLVIRSQSSVEAETLLHHKAFEVWDEEKKVLVESPTTQWGALSCSSPYGLKRPTTKVPQGLLEPPPSVSEKNQGKDSSLSVASQKQISSQVSHPSKLTQIRDAILPMWQKINRQVSETTGALYFSLAIIAFIVLSVVIISVVLVVKKNKSKANVMIPKGETISVSPFTASVAAENENVRPDHYEDLSQSGYLSEAESDLSEAEEQQERTSIDGFISQQNQHFQPSMRAEYTRADFERDSLRYTPPSRTTTQSCQSDGCSLKRI